MSFDGFHSGAPITPLPQALLRDVGAIDDRSCGADRHALHG